MPAAGGNFLELQSLNLEWMYPVIEMPAAGGKLYGFSTYNSDYKLVF